jgi:hypothetical protein
MAGAGGQEKAGSDYAYLKVITIVAATVRPASSIFKPSKDGMLMERNIFI